MLFVYSSFYIVYGFTASSLTVSESGTLTDMDMMNGVKGPSVGVFFIDGLEAVDITASTSRKTFTYAPMGCSISLTYSICIYASLELRLRKYFISQNAGRQDGDFTFTDASVTQIPVSAQRPSVVRFSALEDRVAQEGNETFQIRITSITPPLPPGNFLRDTVTITITDNNCKYSTCK